MSAPENVTAPVNEAVAAAMDSTVPLNEKEASFKEDNVDLEGGGVLMKEDITAAEFHFEHENNKFGVEIRGIERVLPEDRKQTQLWQNLTMWGSANLCLSTLITGAIGRTIFALGLGQCIGVIVGTNILTCAIVGYMSAMGPKLGMRQMVITRYSFGWWPSKLIALVNCIACIGWSMINVYIGAAMLYSISDGKLPMYGGILLLAFATIIVGVFGYKLVHYYEMVAWLPLLIIFIVVVAKGAGPYITNVQNLNETSLATAGSVLSYMGALIGFTFGWASFAADFNCNMPEDSNPWVVGGYTFAGLFLPLTLVEIFGILVVSTAGYSEEFAAVLGFNNTTALLVKLMEPLGGGGTFCLVLLALSTIANNVPNDYSLGLSLQVAGPRAFMKVPRWVWTLIGSAIYVIIACALSTSDKFSSTLENFLLVIGYWGTIYVTVVCLEDALCKGVYNVHIWNNPTRLPIGWAASAALVMGVVGAVLGMAQVWFVGPVAALFGPYGGDVGPELAAAFSGVTYLCLRPLERKYSPRP